MLSAQEMYPDLTECGEETFYGPGDYGPMLASIGTIVVQVDDSDYQGDSRVLYRDGDRYGVLLFGWGSCSGCDALQGCNTYAEIQEMRDGLANRVVWGTREQTVKYLKGKDFESESTYHEEETAKFVSEAMAALS